MIYGNLFNKIFDTLERIEQHIGLRYFTDSETINGRLNNLEVSQGIDAPSVFCEVDVPINGDSFTTLFNPLLIGDAWVVNNSVMITVDQGDSNNKVMHEWGDIEFVDNVGTLMGANGLYDGMVLTLTYFYNQTMLYYGINFTDGYPEVTRTEADYFNLIIGDSILPDNQRIFIDSKGRVSSFSVQDDISGDNIFTDTVNGSTYELYAENGNINWRTV